MQNIYPKYDSDKNIAFEKDLLSIVAPVFNEEGNLDIFIDTVETTCADIDMNYELILVNDGSNDNTWSKIVDRSRINNRIKGLSLSRNFGHQHALFAGLHYAAGEVIISMDGDMQHPPELIPELLNKWHEGFKVVTTYRIDSDDTSIFKRVTSKLFYKVFSRLSGLDMREGNSDFRLVDRIVLESIKKVGDCNLFIRGITSWVGFSMTTVNYKAANRYAGKSKYSLFKMLRFSTSAIVSFSIIPLKLGIWIGFITSFLAAIEIIYILYAYYSGNTVAGWTSVMALMSFMFGILFFMIGIIGMYLSDNNEILKRRPRFIVQETVGI